MIVRRGAIQRCSSFVTVSIDRGQPHCQTLELIEVERNSEIDIACKTPKIAMRINTEVARSPPGQFPFSADLADPRQIRDLIRR